MKNLLITLAFCLSSTAYAKIIYQFPLVSGLSIDNACATETSFKSINKIQTCVETTVDSRVACNKAGEAEFCRPIGNHDNPGVGDYVKETIKCAKYEAQHMEVPRVSLIKRCTQWDLENTTSRRCLKYETSHTILGRTFQIEAFKELTDHNLHFLGYESFEIPNCK